MCGIAGYAGERPNKETLARMLEIMPHRGPDARGMVLGEGYGIGHNRLAIVDQSPAANQPFVSLDGRTVLAVNGEIYNFMEIRRDLEQRGRGFRSCSDSEVLLEGFLEFGESIFERLNGMFAAALWDGVNRRLLLVRDRLGIKPLYYTLHQGNLYFGSELKAIAACPEIPLDLDWQGLAEYLCYEHYFAGRTMNRAIGMVQPGEVLCFHDGRLESRRFWQPRFHLGDMGDVYEAYRIRATQAVERHLLSDVPVGCYLSAGIDSSIVAGLANQVASAPIPTFTGAFGLPGYFDESKDAARFAEGMGSPNHAVLVSANDFPEVFQKICWHLDEPRAGMGAFPQFLVAKRASQDVRVVLTGHGGDELFAGYPVFRNALASRHPLQFLKRSTMRELVIAGCFGAYPLIVDQARFGLPVVMPPRKWGELLVGDALVAMRETDPGRILSKIQAGAATREESASLVYIQEYLPSLFIVEDKIGMAFSMESRTPLCDNNLLDLALSIPLSVKLRGMELKHIPRFAMQGLLPDWLYGLPKRGFPTPLRIWFKTELKEFLRDYIATGVGDCPFIDPAKANRMVEQFFASRLPFPFNEIQANRVWQLINLIAHAQWQKRRYAL